VRLISSARKWINSVKSCKVGDISVRQMAVGAAMGEGYLRSAVLPLALAFAAVASFREPSLVKFLPRASAYGTAFWFLARWAVQAPAGPWVLLARMSVAPFALTIVAMTLMETIMPVNNGWAWVTLLLAVLLTWLYAGVRYDIDLVKASISIANGISGTMVAVSFLLTLHKPFTLFPDGFLAVLSTTSLTGMEWDAAIRFITLPYVLGGLWAKAVVDCRRFVSGAKQQGPAG